MMLWEGDYMDKWTRLRDALYEMQDHLSDENYHLYENVIDEITRFDDWDFKCRLAELLASVNNQHAFHTLLQLAQDRNPLVQVDALDALSSYPSPETREQAIKNMKSRYWLVRGYAYTCLGDICTDEERAETIDLLEGIQEKNMFARINLLVTLVNRGESKYLDRLFKMYPRCMYRNKITILNNFAYYHDAFDQEIRERICAFLRDHKCIYEPYSVVEAYHRLEEVYLVYELDLNTKTIYALEAHDQIDKEQYEEFFIGYYDSVNEYTKVMNRYKALPGFKLGRCTFRITPYHFPNVASDTDVKTVYDVSSWIGLDPTDDDIIVARGAALDRKEAQKMADAFQKKAEAEIKKYQDPSGKYEPVITTNIDEYQINKSHWREGFNTVTWTIEDEEECK